MAYDFGQKRIGTGSNQERNSGMYTKTILGHSVGDIPVPAWTEDKSRSPFAQANPEREFSMRDIICSGKKKVVFIEYDLRKGRLLALMYGILIDRALSNALGGRQKMKNNKYFLLDEILLLPRLEHLSDSLNFGHFLGVRMMCGLQNICGLEEQYGKTGARNILSSFQNMVAFRCG